MNPQREIVYIDAILADLTPGFMQNRMSDIILMEQLLESKNFDGFKKFGHKLKGSSLSYGFQRLGQLAQELETAAAAEDLVAIRKLVADITAHVNTLEISYLN
jgi:HPt (histidine-containing phosphotransfer) domain-containing protein